MSLDAQATAIKALIAAATKVDCYDHDELQEHGTAVPSSYSVIFLSRRYGGNVRGGTRETYLRRLQTRATATSLANLRLIEDRVFELFEHAIHDLDGALVHFDFEGQADTPERDARGYYERLTDWTFAV